MKFSAKIRYGIILGAFLVAFAPVFNFYTQAASISDLQKQKEATLQKMKEAQAAAEQKKKDAAAISEAISQIDSNINAVQNKISNTQNQINKTQKEIDETLAQIAQKEQELQKEQDNQDEAIRVMYETVNKSTLEVLASSEDISDVVKYGDYLDGLENKIEDTINQINKLKQELENKKADLDKKKKDLVELKHQLIDQNKSLDAEKNQKNNMLSMTVSQQKDYLNTANQLSAEAKKISDEIYQERLKELKNNDEVIIYGSTSYPYADSPPDIPDHWWFYTRECTSYAAWYWNVKLGKPWVNTRPGQGSAWNWPALARDQGYGVSQTPRVGAIISWVGNPSTMPYGHVAIVEVVNENGTIDVSEYNWVRFSYSYRKNVNPAAYGGYSFIW